MQQFTLKDFINYNGPCKSCGSKIDLFLAIMPKDIRQPIVREIPSVYVDKFINFVLLSKYKTKAILVINPTTNEYAISSNTEFDEDDYMNLNNLLFHSKCNSCKTEVETNFLALENKRIKAFTLYNENLNITIKDKKFVINNFHYESRTTLWIVDTIDANGQKQMWSDKIELPLMPLGSFKNKQALIDKLNLILALS